MPAQTSPRRARHGPLPPPVRQRFRPVPARRGQTAPPHTAHPDQQNAQAVKLSFLGAQVRLSLAVALLLAAIAGALLVAAARTARITQLRQAIRRTRRGQPPAPAAPGRQATAPGRKEQRPC